MHSTPSTPASHETDIPADWSRVDWDRDALKAAAWNLYHGQRVRVQSPTGALVPARLVGHTPGSWHEFTVTLETTGEEVTFKPPASYRDATYQLVAYEPFNSLSDAEQLHLLWWLVHNDLPFRYAPNHAKPRMRRFFAGGIVPRANDRSVLFRTIPHIQEMRHVKNRPECDNQGRKSTPKVSFSTHSTKSAFDVTEGDVFHELTHAIIFAHGYDVSLEARSGRNDRAWYYNGGLPNWDFNGKDPDESVYLLRQRFDGDSHIPGEGDLDELLDARESLYESRGLIDGPHGQQHAFDGRPNPFAYDTTREPFETGVRPLIAEANIAWYTTAKAFDDGYEELARHSIGKSNYSATNPAEMLCTTIETLQSPWDSSSSTEAVARIRYRHPWLLKRCLDLFDPHPNKIDLLRDLDVPV